jgi:hypothetical protein
MLTSWTDDAVRRILAAMDKRGRWVLAAAVIGSGMVFLDSTVVTVALPRMGADLPSTYLGVLEAQSYVYNGYLLSLSALFAFGGRLADIAGHRRMVVIGVVGFATGSALFQPPGFDQPEGWFVSGIGRDFVKGGPPALSHRAEEFASSVEVWEELLSNPKALITREPIPMRKCLLR